MNMRFYLTLLVLISLSLAICLGSAFAADRSYTIPSINMDLYLQDDGSLHVKETIHYSFSGTFHGVYRDIPISGSQEIQNIKISTPGVYSDFTVTNQSNNRRITINLYSDAQKTNPITDRDVDIILEYDFAHVIKFYNDVAELQYKLVGEGWSVDIGKVNANVHFKSNDGVKYWLNPPYYTENSIWQGNELQITSKNIPSGEYYELRMVIPKNQFAANPTNGIIINQNGLTEIESIQNNYQNQINYKTNLYALLTILMLLSCFIPLIIYVRYGREPRIDYQAEYERDIPTEDPPAIVNAICGPGFSKKIGEPDLDGFKATIMDLIDRKFLIIKSEQTEKSELGLSGSMSFKVNPEKDTNSLRGFEKDIIDFLRGYEEEGLISLDRISDDLSDKSSAKSFRETYENWKDDIKGKFLTDDVLNKIFNKKGDKYLKIYGLAGIIAAALVFFFTLSDQLPAAGWAFLSSIVLGIVAITSLIMPQRIAGQWTTYGEEYDAKWHNFKKYIQDFSLIKEYPPESIVIWNKYLVYATALGVADAVRKAMELSIPRDQLESSDIYLFHYYGGYALLTSSFDTGMTTAAAGSGGGDFGGVGDVGGGFGGGGGGAF
ncbi:MAG: DUF2207 domain-containing protein [Methanobacterium sp.]|nr:DUF2207 domain-containing protein [Methanobacterium sp.]